MAISDQMAGYLPSLGGFKTGSLLFLGIIFLLVSLLFLIWLIVWLGQFKIRVDVEERRGKNLIEYSTRGGIVLNKKKNIKEFALWRTRYNPVGMIRGAIPSNDMFRITGKGKNILRAYKDSVDTFKVIPPFNEDEVLPPVDLDWYNWAGQSLKGLAPRYRNDKGMFKENAGLIAFGGVLFVFLAIVILGMGKWVDGTEQLASAASSVEQTTANLVKIQSGAQGVQVIEGAKGNIVDRNDGGGG